MAEISLVRCPSLFVAGALTLSATPPIGLAYIAANLRRHNHEVRVVDGVGEAITHVYRYETPASLNLFVNGLSIKHVVERICPSAKYIGVSLPFSHEWPLARALCNEIGLAFPDAIIFVGGEHATAVPEFCLSDCAAIDFCILGEGEETAVELVEALELGNDLDMVSGIAGRHLDESIYLNPRRNRVADVDDIPWPAWDLIPVENYLGGGYSYGVDLGRTLPIVATRGCPYQCTFCSSPSMWTTKWTARTATNVIEEIKYYKKTYGVSNVDFYDLTAVIRKDWIVEFCTELIEQEIGITWQLPSGTRSEALDHEVTALLYESGCRNLTYAPESGSAETLKIIKKKVKPDRMIASMKDSIKNNINIKANIIVGFPNEKFYQIFQTYKFIFRMAVAGVHDVSVWTFSAYPGSEIFSDLEGRNLMPRYSDEYFFSLLSYSDLRQGVSWNQNFSNIQLKVLRVFGLLIFYIASYLFRPSRLVSTFRNLYQGKPSSRMEMILNKAIRRHRKVIGSDQVALNE
jgi:anaerobic magnesium-protoporphyrin IX monomethyl ester cyclase